MCVKHMLRFMKKQILESSITHDFGFIRWMFMSATVQTPLPQPLGLCPFFETCRAAGPCTSLGVYSLTPSCQASASRLYCCYAVANSINVIIAGDSLVLSFQVSAHPEPVESRGRQNVLPGCGQCLQAWRGVGVPRAPPGSTK